jgi:aspartate carbamoyltransferase
VLFAKVKSQNPLGFFMHKSGDSQAIHGDFKGKDILTLSQFDAQSISILLKQTARIKRLIQAGRVLEILKGNIVTLLFYEPSSRTFGSFSTSIKRLGGQTISIQDAKRVSSIAKGESLKDTIRVFNAYSDAIILRHPQSGAAEIAARVSEIPIINAGDGTNEHPTQALMDLYTLYEHFGKLDNLKAVFAGDMLNGRTVHSLLRGLTIYKNNIAYLLSPPELQLAKADIDFLQKSGLTIIQIDSENDIPKDAHFWYWTRVQKERFTNLDDYERTKHRYILTKELLAKKGNSKLIIMHPLPRVGEILEEVDQDKRAVYFGDQIKNGVFVRMALLGLIIGRL